jgi:hypothetical protein
MKVKDTTPRDLIWQTLRDKARNFAPQEYKSTPQTSANMEYIKHNYPRWQYTGVAPFEDVMIWCEQHFGNNWIWNFETIYFKREEDRTMFMLRWAQ